MELNYDNFMEEFTAILHRQALPLARATRGKPWPERVDEVVRSQVRNQHCTVAGRTAGAVVIFMATAPIITQSVEVDLPDLLNHRR